MIEHIDQRLKELKAEFESGQKMLMELRAKEENLKETLLRISGAIQVLEEILEKKRISDEEIVHKEEVEATN